MGKSASTLTKRPEKRRKARRNTVDRRDEVRWEKPSSKSKRDERRTGTGRRQEDKVWDKIRSKN
ncbi:MAG: hypothetical protein E2O37_03075 [Proteobacteria bacterium]|nr:MAG: hypothetical protein E2O37_03075 [Pseudomonadota bacterium]TDJ70406.1 MAG: hypothetical protein E2O38_11330 [Pseudomonadota bacterium]